jgi:two-component system NtrC family sensor kinase
MVGIDFKDNGYGMSEEVKKHIFDPFFTTKQGKGTGLGLSITYGIVKKLKGKISFESRENLGTTFTILLPEEETYESMSEEE